MCIQCTTNYNYTEHNTISLSIYVIIMNIRISRINLCLPVGLTYNKFTFDLFIIINARQPSVAMYMIPFHHSHVQTRGI